jgi:hypothetical protein
MVANQATKETEESTGTKVINRIGAMAPILVPLFGVFFLGVHLPQK